jgi:hypothetical protein
MIQLELEATAAQVMPLPPGPAGRQLVSSMLTKDSFNGRIRAFKSSRGDNLTVGTRPFFQKQHTLSRSSVESARCRRMPRALFRKPESYMT